MSTTFCGVQAGRLKNGKVNLPTGRTLAQWKEALNGHRLSAHGGAVKDDCQGCKTLLQRIEEAQ